MSSPPPPSLPPTTGKALVLGSGHLGAAFAHALQKNGYTVTVCARRKQAPLALDGVDLRYVCADIGVPGAIDECIQDHQLVVDAAAPYPLGVRRLAKAPGAIRRLAKARAGGTFAESIEAAVARTERVLRAVERQGASLVFVSSFSTLSPASTQRDLVSRLDSSLARRLFPYFEVKKRLEEQVLEAARRGLRAVVVNPVTCFGPWDSKPRELCLIPRLLDGEVPFAIRHPLPLVDVRDVATVALSALEQQHFAQPMAVIGHRSSTEIVLRRICELGSRLGHAVEAPSFGLPRWLGRIGTSGAGLAAALAPREADSTTTGGLLAVALLQAGAAPIQGSWSPLRHRPISLSKTLVDSIAWYRQMGY